MTNILCSDMIKLTKPTNVLSLSKKASSEKISVLFRYEDGDIIKFLQVKEHFGNKIFLVETVDPESVESRYWQKRDFFGRRYGAKTKENVYAEVFYETKIEIGDV